MKIVTHTISLIIIIFLINGCELLNSTDPQGENAAMDRIEEALDNDPNDYNACLEILDDYQDSLSSSTFDSTLAKAVMEKLTDMDIKFNFDNSQVSINGPLKSCVVVNSAEISFVEHKDSWSERNLMKFFDDNTYPLVEINVLCRVVARLSNDLYTNSIHYEVGVNGFGSDMAFGKFKLKDEEISDYFGPNTAYKLDKDQERSFVLRYKLWDEGEALDSGNKITDRTRKIFNTLKALSNTSNLKINLELYPNEESGGGGETIHTGPRGGRYIIRNGGKRYVK